MIEKVKELAFVINSSVKIAWEENELVLMNLETGKFYGLDQIGSDIWRMIEENKSIDDVITILHKKYSAVTESSLREDVNQLISQLQSAQIIRDV